MTEPFVLRTAILTDIPVLVRHRRWMFEDMARLRGETLVTPQYDAMDKAYNRYLHRRLGSDLVAWVVENEGQVVSSGSVVVFDQLPSYRNITGRLPYLHSIYTVPAARRHGCARQVVERAIAYCKQQGFQTLRLHASEEGRPLYVALGFHDTNEMRLNW